MNIRRLFPPLLAGALAACLGSVASAGESLANGEATRGMVAMTVEVIAADSAVAAEAAQPGEASPRSRKKLRFGGGPTCNCASGLGEDAIEAAAHKRRLTPSSKAAERTEREN